MVYVCSAEDATYLLRSRSEQIVSLNRLPGTYQAHRYSLGLTRVVCSEITEYQLLLCTYVETEGNRLVPL